MKALILLGCPEMPAQTAMSIWACNKLKKLGYEVVISCNPAAGKLLDVSDPDKHYLGEKVNIDSYLDEINPGDYDLLLGFVHKDAAASYFVTYYSILNCKSIALIFEKDQNLINEFEEIVSQNTDAHIVSVRAYHNPNPIKVHLNKAFGEYL